MANGRKTTTIKLPGFIQSTILAIYSSCKNCFRLRIAKIGLLIVFQLFFKLNYSGAMLFSIAPMLLLYVQKQKQIFKKSDVAKKNRIIMRRPLLDPR